LKVSVCITVAESIFSSILIVGGGGTSLFSILFSTKEVVLLFSIGETVSLFSLLLSAGDSTSLFSTGV